MAGAVKQIIGSFEDIGKNVAEQTVSVPKDIAGKAIESLGNVGGQKPGQTVSAPTEEQNANKPSTPLDEIEMQKDKKNKQAIARSALQYLAKKPQERELGVYERLEKEKQEQKELQKKQEEEAKKMELKPVETKQRRGSLPGLVKKQAGSETSRNVRQD